MLTGSELNSYADDFDIFYSPIQWKKMQYHESSEMNIMGNIKEPFESTGKFEVTFTPLPPRYIMEFSISSKSNTLWKYPYILVKYTIELNKSNKWD